MGWGMDEMYWLVPRFGFGKVPAFTSRTALGSIRLAGIDVVGEGLASSQAISAVERQLGRIGGDGNDRNRSASGMRVCQMADRLSGSYWP